MLQQWLTKETVNSVQPYSVAAVNQTTDARPSIHPASAAIIAVEPIQFLCLLAPVRGSLTF
jgi:hypothetical protein